MVSPSPYRFVVPVLVLLNTKRHFCPIAKDQGTLKRNPKDRLSDLPHFVLLHTLSFMNTKHAIQTCVLSRRWRNLWKLLPTLTLHSFHFWTFKTFTKFVSMLLTRRDTSSTVLNLDFERHCCIEPHVLKRMANYAILHKVYNLGISVKFDIVHIPQVIFSCKMLTSLKLSIFPRVYIYGSMLFPKSLNLTALTILHLHHFTFCASGESASDRGNRWGGRGGVCYGGRGGL
ncbi:putative F-box/FBD/LRR-repeat protein At4g13965 [Arachis stenosperma]|uniref:putative F-box/FBD/LRR-repeat protein At4g13965 n=1 Tax=Arachis stenosperma TaxID=217475 RepID=UPI0025AD6181|nr:putative F-box/FBD/LRR-repeat protein At4g13965 [Arachis stenosperma]